jgi:nitrogen fixation protein
VGPRVDLAPSVQSTVTKFHPNSSRDLKVKLANGRGLPFMNLPHRANINITVAQSV